MLCSLSHLALLLGLLASARAHNYQTQNYQTHHGLIGYGISFNQPACAYACQAILASSALNCSDIQGETYPSCYATDDAFLQSLAFCIQRFCPSTVSTVDIEMFWDTSAVGFYDPQPLPKVNWQQALDAITTSPVRNLTVGDALKKTLGVAEADYALQLGTLSTFTWIEYHHSTTCLIVILGGFIIPLFLSFLRFVPWPARLVNIVEGYVINPPLFGQRHAQPLPFRVGTVPTRGQALFISYLVGINVVMGAIFYRTFEPSAWFTGQSQELRAYFADRMGVLALANLPLVILYSGRNNILLFLTNWNRGTFLLLHHWLGYVCIVEASLHGVLYLYDRVHENMYWMSVSMSYWIWGSVAVLAFVIILPTSWMPVRVRWYEVFLVGHIALAVLAVAGCYLHIWYLYQHLYGYEVWTYAAFALLGFEYLSRLARVLRAGVLRRAIVTAVDDDYFRMDIEGQVADGFVYLYFPTMSWVFWQSHPFSVASSLTPIGNDRLESTAAATPTDVDAIVDYEHGVISNSNSLVKESGVVTTADADDLSQAVRASASYRPGLVVFIRREKGMTAILAAVAAQPQKKSIPTLIEASYDPPQSYLAFPTMVAVAGGVGVTAILGALRAHQGRRVLYWGSRSAALVREVQGAGLMPPNVETHVRAGQRWDLEAVLQEEVGACITDTVVIVCGPAGMRDQVRVIVSQIATSVKGGRKIKLVDESFDC